MTTGAAVWRIVPFNSKVHDRSAFSCGAPELDNYIRRLASQDMRRDVARVFVAAEPDADTVVGYYTLSAANFRREAMPADQAKRLPYYPVPGALLGRLAVDSSQQGRGLGAYLLMDALERVHSVTQVVAMQALVVDARDDAAAAFHRKFGFVEFADDQRRLFLPLATIRRLIAG